MRTSLQDPILAASVKDGWLELTAEGPWTVRYASTLEHLIEAAARASVATQAVRIDLAQVGELDTFGAWLLERLKRVCRVSVPAVSFVGVPERYRGLLDEVAEINLRASAPAKTRNWLVVGLDELGSTIAAMREDATHFAAVLGALAAAFFRALRNPRTFRLTSAVYQLDRVGWQAIGIILLITFLIGCIIAQQGFFHFRKFGANDYVVDLVGILVVREIGVLIVAIMVAGRSGSSYTAELGSMKMREELDALRTMGLNPVDVLMLPRVLALIIALPILTFLGNLAALYGGGLVAWLYGGMSPSIYIARLHEALSVQHFEVGMIKAPFMALVVGVVACSEGMRVKGSAESLGTRTTTSVVKSIFLVIVLDGLFAIFFASIGI